MSKKKKKNLSLFIIAIKLFSFFFDIYKGIRKIGIRNSVELLID